MFYKCVDLLEGTKYPAPLGACALHRWASEKRCSVSPMSRDAPLKQYCDFLTHYHTITGWIYRPLQKQWITLDRTIQCALLHRNVEQCSRRLFYAKCLFKDTSSLSKLIIMKNLSNYLSWWLCDRYKPSPLPQLFMYRLTFYVMNNNFINWMLLRSRTWRLTAMQP